MGNNLSVARKSMENQFIFKSNWELYVDCMSFITELR